MYSVFIHGLFNKYNLSMRAIQICRPRKIAFRPSTKCEDDMLFFEVDISVDCTETKDFISYIIFQLTKLQVDLMNFTFTFYFYGFATFSSWRHNKKRYRIFRSTQSIHVYVLWHVTQNEQIRELFIMHLNNIHVHVCNALQLKLTNGAMVYIF